MMGSRLPPHTSGGAQEFAAEALRPAALLMPVARPALWLGLCFVAKTGL
jgi:hypothetical protein